MNILGKISAIIMLSILQLFSIFQYNAQGGDSPSINSSDSDSINVEFLTNNVGAEVNWTFTPQVSKRANKKELVNYCLQDSEINIEYVSTFQKPSQAFSGTSSYDVYKTTLSLTDGSESDFQSILDSGKFQNPFFNCEPTITEINNGFVGLTSKVDEYPDSDFLRSTEISYFDQHFAEIGCRKSGTKGIQECDKEEKAKLKKYEYNILRLHNASDMSTAWEYDFSNEDKIIEHRGRDGYVIDQKYYIFPVCELTQETKDDWNERSSFKGDLDIDFPPSCSPSDPQYIRMVDIENNKTLLEMKVNKSVVREVTRIFEYKNSVYILFSDASVVKINLTKL